TFSDGKATYGISDRPARQQAIAIRMRWNRFIAPPSSVERLSYSCYAVTRQVGGLEGHPEGTRPSMPLFSRPTARHPEGTRPRSRRGDIEIRGGRETTPPPPPHS